MPRDAAESLALWVLHAHAHDIFLISPVLGITSPTPECGKSTLLTIVGAMVPRALTASNITTSGVFRAVEKWRPTLLIDEADTFIGVNDEMRGVLNSGHQKVSAYVIRIVDTGSDHEPRLYRTWAPKAIAMIGKMPSTLTSRSIRIELQKKQPGANVKPLRTDRLDHLKPLLQQAARWVADNKIKLGATDPDMPAGIGNRTADNWRPLIAIADVAGGDWPERARRIAVGDKMPVQEAAILLLHDIQKIFETERVPKIASQELANKLVGAGDELWVEYRHGKQITQRQIAELLEPFRITPKNIRFGTVVQRGYQLEQFKEAFSSYTPVFAATALQASETAENEAKSSATADSHVADKNDEKTSNSAGCSAVAAKTPPAEEPEQKTPWQAAEGNGYYACAHCGEAGEIGDQLVSALIPGRNQHGWLHRRCRRDLTLQNKQGQPS
jgi:putative DNA primase/helicase